MQKLNYETKDQNFKQRQGQYQLLLFYFASGYSSAQWSTALFQDKETGMEH